MFTTIITTRTARQIFDYADKYYSRNEAAAAERKKVDEEKKRKRVTVAKGKSKKMIEKKRKREAADEAGIQLKAKKLEEKKIAEEKREESRKRSREQKNIADKARIQSQHPLVDDFYCGVTLTKISFMSQETSPGRNSIVSGMHVEGSKCLEILGSGKFLVEIEDIKKCTIAIPVASINDPRMSDLKAKMIRSLTCKETKVVQFVNHSLCEDQNPFPKKMKRTNHANH